MRWNGRDMMKRLGYISSLGLFIVLVLSGCATSQTEAPIADDQIINKNNVKVIGVATQAAENKSVIDLLQQVKKISVITPEGSELELTNSFWKNQILHKLDQLTESKRLNQSYSFTLILRTETESPLLMQVSNESMTIGDTTYISEILPQMVLDIRGAIGKQLIANLAMEQFSVFMLDVASYPLDFATEDVDELRKVIESATFIHESTDLKFPLFPHYVVQILDGDKSVVHLDIIGNNIISIPYGKEQSFYYHLSENLYARFYRILPPFDFLDDNPKSLFNATAIKIIEKDHEPIQFGQEGMVDTVADSVTDSFVRLLVDGNKLVTMDDEQAELFRLSFMGSDQKREVIIYADGYTYRGHFYQSLHIGDKIRKHLSSLK